MKVWLDGRIVDGKDAKISVTDHGLLYGDGIFEGMRVIGRRVFRLNDHMFRFETSAKAIGLELPLGRAEIQSIVLDTARAFGADSAYIRLIATRGEGELGVDPATCQEPCIICMVGGISLFPQEKLVRGIDLVTVSMRRPASDMLDPRVKSLNYLNSVLAKREARLRGADEALLLNQLGNVAEASVANVFAVINGTLATPPVTDGALAGITRMSVLECASDLGIKTREATLGRFDLFGADEVFLTGTGARLVPVATLDGQIIGNGERPVVWRLLDAMDRFAQVHGTLL